MRVRQGLTRSWICGNGLQRQKVRLSRSKTECMSQVGECDELIGTTLLKLYLNEVDDLASAKMGSYGRWRQKRRS
jgi:hypothetical protein